MLDFYEQNCASEFAAFADSTDQLDRSDFAGTFHDANRRQVPGMAKLPVFTIQSQSTLMLVQRNEGGEASIAVTATNEEVEVLRTSTDLADCLGQHHGFGVDDEDDGSAVMMFVQLARQALDEG